MDSFITSSHSNLNPSMDEKCIMHPKSLEKPMMPNIKFSKNIWEHVKNQYPDAKISEINQIIGQMWRDLNMNEKQEYFDRYEIEKNEYEKNMKLYQNSSSYQSYLAIKLKEESDFNSSMISSMNQVNPNNHYSSSQIFGNGESMNSSMTGVYGMSHQYNNQNILNTADNLTSRLMNNDHFMANQPPFATQTSNEFNIPFSPYTTKYMGPMLINNSAYISNSPKLQSLSYESKFPNNYNNSIPLPPSHPINYNIANHQQHIPPINNPIHLKNSNPNIQPNNFYQPSRPPGVPPFVHNQQHGSTDSKLNNMIGSIYPHPPSEPIFIHPQAPSYINSYNQNVPPNIAHINQNHFQANAPIESLQYSHHQHPPPPLNAPRPQAPNISQYQAHPIVPTMQQINSLQSISSMNIGNQINVVTPSLERMPHMAPPFPNRPLSNNLGSSTYLTSHLTMNNVPTSVHLNSSLFTDEGISDFDYEDLLTSSNPTPLPLGSNNSNSQTYLIGIDDSFEKYSKRISSYRFNRNTRLMLEIFSEVCVPDTRTIVTSQRMAVLKRQVLSLNSHQKKLETELDDIKQKFKIKKDLIKSSSEAFHKKLQQNCQFKPMDEMYGQIVMRMREQFQKQLSSERELREMDTRPSLSQSDSIIIPSHQSEENTHHIQLDYSSNNDVSTNQDQSLPIKNNISEHNQNFNNKMEIRNEMDVNEDVTQSHNNICLMPGEESNEELTNCKQTDLISSTDPICSNIGDQNAQITNSYDNTNSCSGNEETNDGNGDSIGTNYFETHTNFTNFTEDINSTTHRSVEHVEVSSNETYSGVVNSPRDNENEKEVCDSSSSTNVGINIGQCSGSYNTYNTYAQDSSTLTEDIVDSTSYVNVMSHDPSSHNMSYMANTSLESEENHQSPSTTDNL
ncbi:unnamed protein product [Gordionus sp. m RMFG-2023]|uniref:hybrid signal transduction histidine kinase A-like n=1 Tax=Gordionus sp. m RMFG-2023 TaxID=3053472 RepID=UPI0030E36EEC